MVSWPWKFPSLICVYDLDQLRVLFDFCFSVAELLLVGFCVVVLVLFSFFGIFCVTSFNDYNFRNTKKLPMFWLILI